MNRQITLSLKDVIKWDKDFNIYSHYAKLETIKDYIVEKLDYSHLDIGDNTDFKIKNDKIILDLELISK